MIAISRIVRAGVLVAVFAAAGSAAFAASLTVEMHMATRDGRGESIGHVMIEENKYGLVFTPALAGLPAGIHGFHIHETPDCSPSTDKDGKVTSAGKAGPHYDPHTAGRHSAPWDDNGHLGDLPPLVVGRDGKATLPVLAPRLKKLDDVRGRALMIHEGGDNYSDKPEENGGGGARFACGIIQ